MLVLATNPRSACSTSWLPRHAQASRFNSALQSLLPYSSVSLRYPRGRMMMYLHESCQEARATQSG